MSTRISRRGTTVLVLTSDAGLIRLARSILEPACTVIGRAPLSANEDIRAERTEVVIIDAESVDRDVISTARRACPDAQVIALCREFREADCVAILDADADYLPRPFRAHDLIARLRVAELRRFNATGRPRTYRKGRLAFDLFNRKLAIDGRQVRLARSELATLSHLASQPGVVAEHKQLLAELGLDSSEGSRRALRSCVFRLRRKIERDSLHPEVLLVEAGVGYRLAISTEELSHRAGHRAEMAGICDCDGPFGGVCMFGLYALLRLQGVLPLNPQGFPPVPPDLAFNIAISFITNADWQPYGGETTLSHLSQMVGLTTNNYLDSAAAIAIAAALIRALSRNESRTIGNFWIDMTRATLYILLPLALVVALALAALGVPQTLSASIEAATLEGVRQVMSIGPVASQEAIKLIGDNGGGFFNVNSTHPFENPSVWSNILQNWSQLVLPVALVFAFGRMVGDPGQGGRS